jgi:hypothetical protein
VFALCSADSSRRWRSSAAFALAPSASRCANSSQFTRIETVHFLDHGDLNATKAAHSGVSANVFFNFWFIAIKLSLREANSETVWDRSFRIDRTSRPDRNLACLKAQMLMPSDPAPHVGYAIGWLHYASHELPLEPAAARGQPVEPSGHNLYRHPLQSRHHKPFRLR